MKKVFVSVNGLVLLFLYIKWMCKNVMEVSEWYWVYWIWYFEKVLCRWYFVIIFLLVILVGGVDEVNDKKEG